MRIDECLEKNFTAPLLAWFDSHGRKNLPWQHPRSAYRVWVSEIMLQQTQVKTVIPYFNKFMWRFPRVEDLANASEESVLAAWSGLGYYSRARNLLKTARLICEHYKGDFPQDNAILVSFPGIGPSTAAAITSQTFNQPTPILDGNVRRVLSRYFMIEGVPSQVNVQKKLWELAAKCMNSVRCADYTQAIMDLGATCCVRNKPNCQNCPLKESCQAFLAGKVTEFPNKKIKKQIPTKIQQFIILHTKTHEIYLEKRESSGLWGGLWCCLMLDADVCPKEYLEKRYALEVANIKSLINFKHSFSHFHLKIQALAVQIKDFNHDNVQQRLDSGLQTSKNSAKTTDSSLQLRVAEPMFSAYDQAPALFHQLPRSIKMVSPDGLESQWFNVIDIPTLGIPKPLRQIIETYQQLTKEA